MRTFLTVKFALIPFATFWALLHRPILALRCLTSYVASPRRRKAENLLFRRQNTLGSCAERKSPALSVSDVTGRLAAWQHHYG